jgi:hypothetical protein
METNICIPCDFKQKYKIIIKDEDSNIVIRHAIILLLALTLLNGEASELILHPGILHLYLVLCGVGVTETTKSPYIGESAIY